MSEVTNVLLAHSILEPEGERIAAVNRWLAENDQPFGFKSVWESRDCVGGSKNMEAPLYAGAFNYFPLQEFLGFLRTIAWGEPDCVELLICGQDETRGHIIDA